MNCIFIQHSLLTKLANKLQNVEIRIGKPYKEKDLYVSLVEFSIVGKYDAKIKGADEFNAVDGALRYVDKIIENSTDPEFFWNEGESLLKS